MRWNKRQGIRVLGTFLTGLGTGMLAGQTAAPADTVVLDAVEVRAGGPESSHTLRPRALNQEQPAALIAALDQLPGVFFINENLFPLVLRGLSGNRLRIERNGAPRTGVVPEGYYLEDINPRDVARVELVQGVRALIYGAGSLAGVVRIDEAGADTTAGSEAYASYGENNAEKAAGLALRRHGATYGLRASGRWVATGDQRYAGRVRALNSAWRSTNAMLAVSRRAGAGAPQFHWRHAFHSGRWEKPQGFQNNPYEWRAFRNAYDYSTDLEVNFRPARGPVVENRLWFFSRRTEQDKDSYDARFERVNLFERRTYTQQAAGIRSTVRGRLGPGWQARAGADLTWQSDAERRREEDYRANRVAEDAFAQERRDLLGGLFALAEHRRGRFGLVVSGRFDVGRLAASAAEGRFTAATGGAEITWAAAPWMVHSASFSRHFRYPDAREALGASAGGRGVFYGNPGIRPESSLNAEWRMRGGAGPFRYWISGWLALFHNRISEVYLGNDEYTYANAARARLLGLEFAATCAVPGASQSNPLEFTISGAFTRGDLTSATEPLEGIPPGRLRLQVDYRPAGRGRLQPEAFLRLDRVFALTRLPAAAVRQTWGARPADAYFLINAGIQTDIALNRNNLTLGLTAANLTDAAYFPLGARVMGMGRNIKTSFQFQF